MLVWTLFLLHKTLMLSIGLGMVLLVLDKPNRFLNVLLAGFLLAQGVLGFCPITVLENAARSHYGFQTSPLHFILSTTFPSPTVLIVARLLFIVIGIEIVHKTFIERAQYGK